MAFASIMVIIHTPMPKNYPYPTYKQLKILLVPLMSREYISLTLF